jgi:uncharacterized membrane protein
MVSIWIVLRLVIVAAEFVEDRNLKILTYVLFVIGFALDIIAS